MGGNTEKLLCGFRNMQGSDIKTYLKFRNSKNE